MAQASRHLFHPDGRLVKIGDEVTSFRGEKYIVTGWEKTGRNRVYTTGGEYFVSVFNLTWDKPNVPTSLRP